MTRAAEAVATAIVGAALGALTWSVVDLHWPAAVIGGLNGAVAGWRRIYQWRSVRGVLALVLDSTWALITTLAALNVHAVTLGQQGDGNYLVALSERRNRHVYARGLTFRRGFLLTVGNVVSGAGGGARRQHVVESHENVHIWQTRWFGPLFPLIYSVWWVVGGVTAVVIWLFDGRKKGLWKVVDTTAYYSNPFEWWAYSREGRWPPLGAIPELTWRRPLRPRLRQRNGRVHSHSADSGDHVH